MKILRFFLRIIVVYLRELIVFPIAFFIVVFLFGGDYICNISVGFRHERILRG